jgi:tetratricopeptide (TPR) repeat protein
MEQLKGACDPAPVPDGLPAAERAGAHMQRAKTLLALMRLEAAYEAVGEALKADPKNADALVLRVRLSMSQMMADAMLRDLNAGLLAAPGNPFLLASRAEYSLQMGDKPAALRDIAAALEKEPNDVDMLWIRARTRMALEQYDEAAKDLDRALSIEDVRRVRQSRAQLNLQRGHFDQAIADTTVLLESRPYDPSAIEVRAVAYTARGRDREAVDDLTVILGKPGEPVTATPAFPHQGQLFVQRAILLMRLDRADDARRDLDTITALGGKRALLRMQIFLRKNGFAEVAVDGQRGRVFDQALESCFINQACGRGLVRSL